MDQSGNTSYGALKSVISNNKLGTQFRYVKPENEELNSIILPNNWRNQFKGDNK